jgi:hypothetical protein
MRMLRSKKGLEYVFVLVLVAFIVNLALFLQVSRIASSIPAAIGEHQVALLNAYQSGENFLLYVDQSAKMSSYWALDAVAKKGGVLGSACGVVKEQNNDISAWSASGKNIDECLKFVQPYDSFSAEFNKRMNAFLSQYTGVSIPQDNYELFVQKDSVTGTAIKQASLWIQPPPGISQATLLGIGIPFTTTALPKAPIGQYSFKPSFTVPVSSGLDAYAGLKKDVEVFYSCTNAYSVDECLKPVSFTYTRSTADKAYLICTAKNPAKNPYGTMSDIVFALYVP